MRTPRLRAAVLLTLAVAAAACSDIYWVRRASAAYTYAEIRFEKDCPVGPNRTADCLARKASLQKDYDTLTAIIDSSTINGKAQKAAPLTKAQRDALKQIAKARE